MKQLQTESPAAAPRKNIICRFEKRYNLPKIAQISAEELSAKISLICGNIYTQKKYFWGKENDHGN